MVHCYISGCKNSSKSKTNRVGFYGLPTVITYQCNLTHELSRRRRALWLSRINRHFENPSRDIKVCGKHFVSGKPSKLFEYNHPDWAPTKFLGHSGYSTGDGTAERNLARFNRLSSRRRKKAKQSKPSNIGHEQNVGCSRQPVSLKGSKELNVQCDLVNVNVEKLECNSELSGECSLRQVKLEEPDFGNEPDAEFSLTYIPLNHLQDLELKCQTLLREVEVLTSKILEQNVTIEKLTSDSKKIKISYEVLSEENLALKRECSVLRSNTESVTVTLTCEKCKCDFG